MTLNFQSAVLIGLGGFLGTLLRFSAGAWISQISSAPWLSTLFVNLLGSFCAGLILSGSSRIPETVFSFLTIGLLGGFTTFSAFSMDSMNLLKSSMWTEFLVYALVTIFFGLALCFTGHFLGAWMFRSFGSGPPLS
jgi:fluoride exporter